MELMANLPQLINTITTMEAHMNNHNGVEKWRIVLLNCSFRHQIEFLVWRKNLSEYAAIKERVPLRKGHQKRPNKDSKRDKITQISNEVIESDAKHHLRFIMSKIQSSYHKNRCRAKVKLTQHFKGKKICVKGIQ